MPLYKVSFEGGHVLYVNAPDEAAAEAHVDHDLVRNPQLKRDTLGNPALRPSIPQRAKVLSVEAVDKFSTRLNR